jgi:UDP-glucose 4-epimerase
MKNIKCLVLGAAGFVGSNIMDRLLKYDHYDVIGIDDLSFGFIDNISDKSKFYQQNVNDLTQSFLNGFDVVVVSYCSNIIYAIEHETETYQNNAIIAANLFMKYHGKIVYLSTSSVYNQAKIIPTPEDVEISTYNAYDTSKYIAELFLKQRGNFTTLRLSNVYGKNQRAENPYCGVTGKFIDAAFKGEPMKIYGDGLSTRDFTYVDDVVDAIIMSIDQDPKNTEINIGTGIETSTVELSNMITDAIGGPHSAKYIGTRSIDKITRRCLDIKKAKQLLGWDPKTSLEKGIESTIFNLK